MRAVRRSGSRLGLQLVMLMVLANACLAAAAAGVQLYLNFDRERTRVVGIFEVIEGGFTASLATALWQFNFQQAEILLDGIAGRTDVVFVELQSTTGQAWVRGNVDAERFDERTFRLTFAAPETTEPVGRLTVGITLERVWKEIRAQFLSLVAANFVKTMLATTIMLVLFSRLVTRHLRLIAERVGSPDWSDDGAPLALERQPPAQPDDLDQVVAALNDARARSQEAVNGLEAEVRVRREAERQTVLQAEKLALAVEQLAATNREQADFTYALSHDLKSPTNTVDMLIERLDRLHGAELSPEARDLVITVRHTVGRMGRLIEDVVSYSRMVERETAGEPVDLAVLVQEVLDDLRSDIEAAGAVVRFDTLPSLTGYRGQLRMLLQNLISNAIKFRSPSRRPEVEVHGEVLEDGRVVVMVRDNGVGIDAKYHERVFGLFQRLHTEEEYAGSGLGLTLCKRVATNHNGGIALRSELDGGTTVEVYLEPVSA